MRRKGELSPSRVDREWPHQIVLPADECVGQQDSVIAEFCADLSMCPRGHSRRLLLRRKCGRREISGAVRRSVVRSSATRPWHQLVEVRAPKQKFC
jgi:hypothetical protein